MSPNQTSPDDETTMMTVVVPTIESSNSKFVSINPIDSIDQVNITTQKANITMSNSLSSTNSSLNRSRARWKLLSKAVKSKQFPLKMNSVNSDDDSSAIYEDNSSNEHSIQPLFYENGITSSFSSSSTSSSACQSRTQSPSTALQTLIHTYGLMSYEQIDCIDESGDCCWIDAKWNYDLNVNDERLMLRFVSNRLTVHELAGFDNSGNVRLWPCEEVLAYLIRFGFLRQHLNGTRICEIGAGMTALAGLVILSMSNNSIISIPEIYLTDGNERSIDNVHHLVQKNFPLQTNCTVRRLRWQVSDDYVDIRSRFDTIIGADCLFVRRDHRHLLHTIDSLLVYSNHDRSKPTGTCYLLAPKRDDTLEQFCNLIRIDGKFQFKLYEEYDKRFSMIARRSHLSSEQYPFLLVLRRIGDREFNF